MQTLATCGSRIDRGSTGEGDPGDDVVLISKEGMSIRFHETDVRSMGRAAGEVQPNEQVSVTVYLR